MSLHRPSKHADARAYECSLLQCKLFVTAHLGRICIAGVLLALKRSENDLFLIVFYCSDCIYFSSIPYLFIRTETLRGLNVLSYQ